MPAASTASNLTKDGDHLAEDPVWILLFVFCALLGIAALNTLCPEIARFGTRSDGRAMSNYIRQFQGTDTGQHYIASS